MNIREKIEELRVFRSLIGIPLEKVDIDRIWGGENDSSKQVMSEITKSKVQILEENLNKLMFLNKVKFIGISGSVGAGFATEEDDIDLFIVVENNCMWLYRFYLEIFNLFHNKIRSKRHGNKIKDKLCINLIAEERGLEFQNDIFNFHELMYLIPVYNKEYLHYIYSRNNWLVNDWGVKVNLLETEVEEKRSNNIIIKILNFKSFLLQLLFMILLQHSPEIDRIIRNNKVGRIEFFPANFRKSKILKYQKELKKNIH